MISSELLGQRIADARKRLGWTQAELGQRLGVTRQTVIATEKGTRPPTNADLVRLAEVLSVPLGELVSERVARAQASARFRMGPRADLPETDVRRAVEELQRLGARYVELERIAGVERLRAPLDALDSYRASEGAERMDPGLAGQDAALTVRNVLGLGDGPALHLEDLLDRHAGLRIFHLDLPAGIAALFLWGEEIGSCVGLHARHPHERRRWSLAHEFGHYLRDRESGDVLPAGALPRRDASERFADAVAEELLIPRAGVSRFFAQIRRENGDRFSPADILRMAATYEVSFQAMTLRLEMLSLLPAGTYERVSRRKTFGVEDARRALNLDRPREEPPRVPPRYLALAMQTFARGELSEGELADYLGADRVAARGLYLEYLNRTVTDERELDLDLATNVLVPAAKARL
jgi:Zn-dependent peptidase ImmA (M78 family)/DNA-binding XRE family transcriptional regulator